jgi:glycine/D-amino acid oxidase-like deaminating enzyme
MQMNAESLKVAIVGTGLAGLAAANRLAQSGRPVLLTLFEKSSRLGGRAGTTVKDGYYLNLGAHALYKAGPAMSFLQQSGIDIQGAPPVQANSQILAGDKLYALPIDAASALSTGLLSVGEKLEWANIISSLGKIDTEALNSVTLTAWLHELTSSVKIRQLLLTMVRLGTYANCPDLMSAGAAIRQLVLGLAGVLYLDHGWQSLVDALRAAIDVPVDEHLGCAVESIHNDVSGKVVLNCKEISLEFDHVVLALPPQQVHKLMPQALSESFVDSLVPCRIACFDVCLSSLPKRQNSFALGLDSPLYYSVHSNAANLTPGKTQAIVQMGYYLEPSEVAGDHALHAMTDLLDRLQPGWQDLVVYKRYLPDMVASFSMPLASGGGGNGLSNVSLVEHGSAKVVACGDWVGDSAQLADASVASGLKAADAILEAASAPVANSLS